MSSEPRTPKQYPYQKAVHQELNPADSTHGQPVLNGLGTHSKAKVGAVPTRNFLFFHLFFSPSFFIIDHWLFVSSVSPDSAHPSSLSRPSLVDSPMLFFHILNIYQEFPFCFFVLFSCVYFFFSSDTF